MVAKPKTGKVVVLGSLAESLINFRRELLLELVARGHEVVAVAPDMDERMSSALDQIGVKSAKLDFERAGINPVADFAFLFRLFRFLRREQPVAFIGYTPKAVVYGVMAAWLARVPKVTGMITGIGYSFLPGAGVKRSLTRMASNFLFQFAMPKATSLIFQNEDDLSLFRAKGFVRQDQRVTVVNGSGVDIRHFDVAPLPEGPVFLMIARFLGAKGIREYAAASKLVLKALPNARCALLGWIDGSPDSIKQSELDEWIKDGLENWGRLSDVRPAIVKASVIVLPTYREGTPRSVLEAMAMGRPIIVSDVPGCKLVVEAGANGLYVEAQSVESLSQAMIQLGKDAAQRAAMGIASRKRVEVLFEAKAVAKATVDGCGL